MARHAPPIRGDLRQANVRELPDESLATRGDERKVVIDFPFDDPGHTPADDRARLNDFRGRDARARTLVWLPSFLSAPAQRDLGTLLRIDHVLAGERLRDFAAHLSPVDQASAARTESGHPTRAPGVQDFHPARTLAWSPPVRNLQGALTGRISGLAIRGARDSELKNGLLAP